MGHLRLAVATVVVTLGAAAPAAAVLSFGARTDYTTNLNPQQVVAAQLNNAGNLDLVAATAEDNREGSVLLSNGAGTFAAQQSLSIGFVNNTSSRVAAYDDGTGDGDLDFMFARTPNALIKRFVNSGASWGWDGGALSAGLTTAVATAEITQNNRPDIIVTTGSSNIRVSREAGEHLNTMTGATPGATTEHLVSGAFDSGPADDLAVANRSTDTVTILRDCLHFDCLASTPVAVHDDPVWVATGDLDGDGDLDLAVANRGADNDVTILRNDGNATFGSPTHFAMGADPAAVALGDLNADGRLDIATADVGATTVSMRVNDGVGGFGAVQTVTTASAPPGVQIADLTGDGFGDVAATQAASASVGVALATTTTGAVNPTPEHVAFGAHGSGTTSGVSTVTITNTGNASLDVGSISATTGFAVPPGNDTCSGTTVGVGLACTFGATFSPATPGPKTGAVTITSNALEGNFKIGLSGSGLSPAQIVVAPGSAEFGSVPTGSTGTAQEITISNSGEATATITSVQLAGAAAGEFTLSEDCGATLAGGASCTASINFAPTSTGAKSAQMQVIDDTPGLHNTDLTGTGITPAQVVVTPAPVPTFGAVVIGQSGAAQEVSVANAGQATATLTSVALAGADAAHFTLSEDCGPTLAGGSSCTATVNFAPTTAGAKAAEVRVIDSTPGSPHTTALAGLGQTPGQVVVAPPAAAFGSVPTGATGTAQQITISNSGDATAALPDPAITGSGASQFTLSDNCGATLAGGGSCTATVNFAPTSTGAKSASLSVADATPGAPHTAALSGTGITPAQIVLTPSPVPSFGSVPVGQSAAGKTVTITNSGQATATITDVSLSGADAGQFTLSEDCGATLGGGATCTATVGFAPGSPGAKSAVLRVADNTPGAPHTTALSGIGLTPAQIVLDPVAVDFGDVPAGGFPDPKSITIRNTGEATATISAIEIVGVDAGEFGVVHGCPDALAGGGACTATIGFSPALPGAKTAALSIVDNTPGAPHQSGLAGRAVVVDKSAPTVKLSGPTPTAPSTPTLLKQGLEVPFTASEPGTYDVSLELVNGTAAIAAAKKPVVLGKTRRVLKQAGPLKVRVKLSKSGKRALRRAKRPRLRVVIVGRDLAGNLSRVTRTLKRR